LSSFDNLIISVWSQLPSFLCTA